MDPTESLPAETFRQEDSFRFLRPDEYEALGIDQSDIPPGTFAALKHPSYLSSRFGGNAYGFGFFEVYERLRPKEIKLLQSIAVENPEDVKRQYMELNQAYKNIGLLIRFSSLGRPYYLIPIHLISNTLTHISARVDEIGKIIGFERKKYLKEHHEIGIVAHRDDLIIHELRLRFRDHRFVTIDSLEELQGLDRTLDLFILTRDICEIILMEDFSPLSRQTPSKRRLDQYALYLLWKLHNMLKPDGEIFMLAEHYTPMTNRTTKVMFKTAQEEKNFSLFTHIFKTKRKYKPWEHSVQANIFDLRRYLSSPYVEQEVVDKLLGGRRREDLTPAEIDALPYLNFQLGHLPSEKEQEKTWPKLLSIFFDEVFLRAIVPRSVKRDWKKRFSFTGYTPRYMISYLGQKRALNTAVSDIRKEVMESSIVGCQPRLLADYRNSFEYLIRTLRVIFDMKKGRYGEMPGVYVERLREPFENKKRRFNALNDVIRLTDKIKRLERVKDYLNPDKIEGSRTGVLENLEVLTFFGFSQGELREIVYIVLGHTPLGRIISGKQNEKTLKPVTDLARRYDARSAINLLRYCCLMTVAETEASGRSEPRREQLAELFDLYEASVRIVTNRELEWDQLLDEKINAMGGAHNKIIRKILMMMNLFEFLDNWAELKEKGQMEKESLADFDNTRLSKIENVIRLVNAIERFEGMYLHSDPLQLPAFYRKFLNIEFHGTGHLFERMSSDLVFTLLWITVNVARGEIINFNPILSDVESPDVDERTKRVEQETREINIRYLDYAILQHFSRQLYQSGSAFIMGTGFQLRVDPETQALEIVYMDMDKDIKRLESLSRVLEGRRISEMPLGDLKILEILFSNLESFYQSHMRAFEEKDSQLKIPARQNGWFQKAEDLREYLRTSFMMAIFNPDSIYTDIDLLYRYTPSFLGFVLPEFTALETLDLSWHLYMTSPVTHYIITATRKFQALVTHHKEEFQDIDFLHRLAQKEFGPMATGIVGVSESQIGILEEIIGRLKGHEALFDALTKSFILQDIGRVPFLREKYGDQISPVDISQAGGAILEREEIAERYCLDKEARYHLIFLVKHHSLLHHIIRGEFSLSAILAVLKGQEKDLFDAFFVFSFIMLSSIREDLILEDLAGRLFQIRALCNKVLDGEKSFDEALDDIYAQRGKLFYALDTCQRQGIPEGVTLERHMDSDQWEEPKSAECVDAGRMIFAMERLFWLRGIRYVQFSDLANVMLKVPLEFIYKKRNFASIGYPTFEKEVYEAFRIYNTIQRLPERARHFILEQLVEDKVRIFGYEKVSDLLGYENQIKLLLIALLAGKKLRLTGPTLSLNFLAISKRIERRYEAVNEFLNKYTMQELWAGKHLIDRLFKAKTGITLTKEIFPDILSIDFQDRMNISQKISHIENINDPEQLKNYFHYSLRSLRKYPFFTEDYEIQLERSFEKRLREITDTIIDQAKRQMDLIDDFGELYNLVSDLLERSWDIGFLDDQKYRLNDLYELRKDTLKQERLSEIRDILETISDLQELSDYWNTVKWYLQGNRRFFGKQFEHIIAKRFDETTSRLKLEGIRSRGI
jgi:hypothetical protein